MKILHICSFNYYKIMCVCIYASNKNKVKTKMDFSKIVAHLGF